MTSDAVQALRLTDEHVPALARFFQTVWNASSTNRPTIHPETPAFGVLRDGELLGYVGTLPLRLWNGVNEQTAHWMKGLMVLPDYRNSGIGYFVLQEAMRHLNLAGSLSVAPAAHRLFQAVGFQDLGPLPNQILLLRPADVLRRLDLKAIGLSRLPPAVSMALTLSRTQAMSATAGVAYSSAIKGWHGLLRRRSRKLDLDTVLPDDAELDTLWAHMRDAVPASPVRDSLHIKTRYFDRSNGPYSCLAVRDHNELVALAVVRHPGDTIDPRLRGIRVAVMSELVARPDHTDAIMAAVGGAESIARDRGAHALICSVSHRQVFKRLRHQGYATLPGTVRVLMKTGGGFPPAVHDWWISRGDGEADGV